MYKLEAGGNTLRAGNVYTSYLNVGHCNSFISHERSGTRYCDCYLIL